MAFEGLTEKLQGALRKLSSKGKLTEDNVKEGMREVRMALLEADVNYAVAKDFIKKVTARCVGTEITGTLSASQQVIKIVNEEMTQLMGGENARLTWSSGPLTVYMLCGLQGAGKTTMAAKLANYLAKQGKSRCSPRATSTAPPPSTSCKSSASRSMCRCMNTARKTRSRLRWKPSNAPGIWAATC